MENAENKLSSTAVIKIDRGALQEAQYDLPQSYGKTESYLLPKDPSWMFLFWDIIQNTFDFVKKEYGADIFAKARSIIRVHDITAIADFNGSNSNSYFDIQVFLDAGSWYINVPQGGKNYICDIGLLTPQGSFILLTRSNAISIPSGKISDIIDEKWMLVEGEYQKLIQMSGADTFGPNASGGASEKLQRYFTQKWNMFGFNGMPSSRVLSSFSLADDYNSNADEDIWLQADCELIVYGQTSKNAKIISKEQSIQSNCDGAFYMRLPLPKGEVSIPIRAQHITNEEKTRSITIKVLREE
ncbi:MAG: DUF4912 domain-containing protein [Elusimicrobiota bacterium]|jgi:hypothetical protein|nr:DUF4912 domain-containing protein [Elusimicrobiota bacterium]